MSFDPETDLLLERRLIAPRAKVWACWTTPSLIKRFFVPAPHRVTDCQIDLRVGGRFDTTFDVEGQIMANTGVYLDIVPGEKLVFTDAYSAGWRPSPEPFMTAILTLADDPDTGGTLYRAEARHRNAEARQQHADMGFHTGWGVVADQLDALAQTLP